jgi:signal transduction histidine kinase
LPGFSPALDYMTGNINELRESGDFLNILLDNISSAIYILDPDLRVQNYNQAFTDIFQRTEDRILGQLGGTTIGCVNTENGTRECGTTKHCDTCDLRTSLLKSLLENIPVNKGVLNREFLIGGQMVLKYFVYTTKLITVQGKKKVLVIVDDITELEQQRLSLEEQNNKLIDLNNQKNNFLGIAAHDLRNPIGSIQTISEILKDSYEEMDKTELESMFKIVFDLSRFSLNLINDLLDISKIEAGRLELKLVSGNYVEFLKNRIKFYKAYAKIHKMKVEFFAGENIPEFYFDDNKLEQVINNLVSNAVKYSLQGALITISVTRKDDIILTTVEDTGQGILADELPEVFKEFQVTSTQATNGESSTGLGLAIVKRIVEEHGGKVGASSQQGKGSTFYFTLPLNNGQNP